MMTKEEIKELKWEMHNYNKDVILKSFYNPIAKFLILNEAKYKRNIAGSGIKDIKKIPAKADAVDIIFKLYADKEIVEGYAASYSKRDLEILMKAVWRGGLNRSELVILFEKDVICIPEKSSYYHRIEPIPEVKAAWGEFIEIFEPRGYYGNIELRLSKMEVWLSLPLMLRKLWAMHLTKPEGYDLKPIPEPGDQYKIHLFENRIFSDLPRILAYYGQGNIKYSQKGYPNHATAKKMSKALKLTEFDPNAEFPVRSLLVAGLLSDDFKMNAISDLPQKVIQKLFLKNFDKKSSVPYLLSHLKGINYYGFRDFESGTTGAIFSIFRQMPKGKWINFENLQNYAYGRFLEIHPLGEWQLNNNRIEAEYTVTENGEAQKYVTSISEPKEQQFVSTPFLAGHVFLLAAFGLMDMAIDPSVANHVSPYDNLYALRLTDLGAYILGLKQDYSAPSLDNGTTLTFDDSSPIIRIEGDVVLGDTMLANYASRVSENRYQFSPGKFLKECKTTKDIKNKIILFKQTVGQKLPPFWEGYLNELVENSKSITRQQGMHVFTIPANDKVLQRIVVQDEVLRNVIIKAEQFNILIIDSKMTIFNNRMKELGYVIG